MTAEPNDQQSNLPGVATMTELFLMWTRSLQEHSGIWGNAWKQMLAEEYGFKKLIRDVAKTYQAQYDFAEKLCRFPLRGVSADVPHWVHFDLREVNVEPNLLSKSASTRDFDRNNFQPLGTDLTPFGPSRVRFNLDAEVLDATTIKVAITSMVGTDILDFSSKADLVEFNNRLASERATRKASASRHVQPKDPEKAYTQITGQYLGMIFDSTAIGRNSAPYLIVMLNL